MALKIKFLIFCSIFFSFNALAQLSPEEKAVFDEVVFSRVKVGEYEKLQKWVIPIRYKVYGDTSTFLLKEVDSVFGLIKKLTRLAIEKSADDDEINMKIVFGKTPESFQAHTLNKKPMASPGNYRRRVNNKSEIYQGLILVNTETYDSRINIKNAFRRMLLKTLGFSKTSDQVPNSLFYSGRNVKVKIDQFDSHLIGALYLAAVKPGMTKDEFDAVLLQLNKRL